jgi:hypothetical protein
MTISRARRTDAHPTRSAVALLSLSIVAVPLRSSQSNERHDGARGRLLSLMRHAGAGATRLGGGGGGWAVPAEQGSARRGGRSRGEASFMGGFV